MPRLPDFTALGQTPSPQAQLSVARVDVSPLEFAVRQGPGEAAIRGGAQIADAGRQMQDRIDTLYAQEATTKAQKVVQALKEDPQHGYAYVHGSDALDPKFLETYSGKFDNSVKSISDSLPNGNARQIFMNHAQVLGLHYTAGLMAHRAGQYEKWADKTENDAIDSAHQMASNSDNAADRDTYITTMRNEYARKSARTGLSYERDFRKSADSAAAGYYDNLRLMDPELSLKAFQHDGETSISDPKARAIVGRQLYLAAAPVLANELSNDPEMAKILAGAKKDLGPETHTGHEMVDNLPDDWKMHVLALARSQLSQNSAQARAALMDRLKDAHAMAANGVPIPEGFMPSESDVVGVEGPERGHILYRDMVIGTQALASSMQAVRGLTSEQQFAIEGAISSPNDPEAQTTLKNIFSTIDRHQKSISRIAAPEAGEGFANAVQRQRILIDAIRTDQLQRRNDPAGYVLQSNPGIASKLSATNTEGDPATVQRSFEDYATSVLAEEQRLGMPRQAILPGSMAQSIVSRFYSSQDGGRNAAKTISDLSNQWGKAWPMVYAQIAKDIPGSAVVIGSGMDPESSAAANLVTAGNMKEKELKDGVPHDVATNIGKKVPEVMTDFRLSMSQVSGGNALFNIFADQTEKLALLYARQGKKDNDAVAQAYDDVIGSRYNFVTNTNIKSPYMVPKKVSETDVARGADNMIQHVAELDLRLPTSRAGLSAKQTKDAYLASLRSSAYWVNAPNDFGLVLYANGAAVLDTYGKPVTRSWDFFKMNRLIPEPAEPMVGGA